MENSFQTSFIPKKPIVTNGPVSGNKSPINIFVVISFFICAVMILATGGLYFYKNYSLQKTKDELSANLLKIRDSFDKKTITELEAYDNRISVSKQVLGNHIVLSPLFKLINDLTLSSIQYTKFSHETTKDAFSVKMSGLARDYKSIALQADVFNTSKGSMFKDVIFSNIAKDKDGSVTFDVEFNVDPALLSYSNNIVNIEDTTVNDVPQTVNTVASPTPTETQKVITEDTKNVEQVVLPATTNTQ